METEAQDFAMPSPKRQRTNSPTNNEANVVLPDPNLLSAETPSNTFITPATAKVDSQPSSSIPGLYMSNEHQQHLRAEQQPEGVQNRGFLDALEIHVESISRTETNGAMEDSKKEAPATRHQESSGGPLPAQTDPPQNISLSTPEIGGTGVDEVKVEHKEPPEAPSTDRRERDEEDHSMVPVPIAESTSNTESQNAGVVLGPTESNLVIAEAPVTGDTTGRPAAEEAEWEVDSSPYESSDSDISSDTTDDDEDDDDDDSDDDDADGDYAMLDPEEQARILMQGDGGSDDEGGKKGKTESTHLRTANEKLEEVIPKPDIVISEDMAIEELGSVQGVVEKTVLIKAKTGGEYQVLESGSLLCLQNRTAVGVVAELLGRVEQPMYTIRFTSDEAIQEAGLSEKGTAIFYVPSHSTFVFTQPLKGVKGSDASNFHDEEVGDDEMEFSDDEAEAEHKRQLKMKRQGRRDDQGGRGRGRGGRGNHGRGGRHDFRASFSDNGSAHGNNAATEISYDDPAEGADEGYTPLTRPANLNEMMVGVEPLEGNGGPSNYSGRPEGGMARGRGRGHGRGDRRGGRGGRSGNSTYSPYSSSNHQGSPGHSNQYNQQQYSPQPMHPPQFPYQYQQPSQPRMAPSNAPPFSPSPISPLPANQHFNFPFQQPQNPYPMHQAYQQNQYHQPQLPGGNISPAFVQNFLQNQQQQQQQQQQHQQNAFSAQNNANGWNNNQAAAAQVQAQLEQLRKNSGI